MMECAKCREDITYEVNVHLCEGCADAMFGQKEVAGERAPALDLERRVLLAHDGEAWYVRRVAWIAYDAEKNERVYHCDRHLGGPYQAIEAAAYLADVFRRTGDAGLAADVRGVLDELDATVVVLRTVAEAATRLRYLQVEGANALVRDLAGEKTFAIRSGGYEIERTATRSSTAEDVLEAADALDRALDAWRQHGLFTGDRRPSTEDRP